MDATLTTSRLVAPGTKRLTLANGDFLIVKHRLNAGETLDLFDRAAPEMDATQPGTLTLAKASPTTVGLAIVTAYLLDWSFTDLEGAIIPIRGASAEEKTAALRLLDFDSLVEVMNAITAHDAAIRQEKKLPSSASAS